KIRIGYVGAIADWYDAKMITEAARARPDFEFHLCGNITAKAPQKLQDEPNIHMYGEIPYEQVPAFLTQMDVLIIPFRIIPLIRACDPVKFYEYCALGKPTVSTPLPELDRAKHLAFIANSADEFCAQVDQAYAQKDNKKFIARLKKFAAQNTWAHRAEQFDAVLSAYPKISVVVLSYGDPELTKQTLHSLKGQGDVYPNMEILVVDNGSPSEALAEIHSYADQFDDIEIIENGENLGFARGNNVGLDRASGEYVLLLNNDTYVSPGSLYAMIRHLQRDEKIGAVGPLTNNIGNEAKLDIVYDNMDEMITRSRALKTGYRGVHFPVRVVAYFAVMFRASDLAAYGHLSQDYGRGMFEDDDHCNVLKQNGLSCVVAEDAFVHHELSATFSKIKDAERQALFDKNKKTYEKKWGKWQAHTYREGREKSALLCDPQDLR
ncbi:MAG TPA: glycosyltransferase, partial [Hellea balneolensis]|nr:glycosyltransferase [Hellea balneolensis]